MCGLKREARVHVAFAFLRSALFSGQIRPRIGTQSCFPQSRARPPSTIVGVDIRIAAAGGAGTLSAYAPDAPETRENP